MADTEVYIGIFLQERLSVLVVCKGWHFADAKAEAKSSQEFDIADSTFALSLQETELPCCLSSPFRQ
jgi:aspartokinase-like uncharacterized kinase